MMLRSRSIRTLIGVLLALASPGARADVVRWIGWSPDESRYAYFLRQPLGETGYTDIHMFVRDSKTGALRGKYVARNASYFIDHPREFDDNEDLLELREMWYKEELIRKGWQMGKELTSKVIDTHIRRVGGDALAFQTARVRIGGKAVDLMTDYSPPTRPRFALLKARSRANGPWKVVSKAPIPPLVEDPGTPDAFTYYMPPTVPTGFQLSPSGKWLASEWQGNGTLPDGFSWPAYVFHTSVSALFR
jgi:hypothetical protein